MRYSTHELVGTIYKTLEKKVLPELEIASWTASALRSSLVMLTLVEDRIIHEERVLRETNGMYRQLLLEVLEQPGELYSDQSLRVRIDQELEDLKGTSDGSESLESLSSKNTAYKNLLVDVIRYAGAQRAKENSSQVDNFRKRLQQMLADIYEKERVLTLRASKLLPL